MKTKSVQRTESSRPLRAFTLMEVVVGMLVVGIVIVSLYTALTFGVRMVQLSRENFRATEILTEKMDMLRVYNWDQILSSTEIPREFDAYFEPPKRGKDKDKDKGKEKGLVYHGRISFSQAWNDVSYRGDLTNVTVSLSWTSATSVVRSRQFTTLIARNGLQSYIY